MKVFFIGPGRWRNITTGEEWLLTSYSGVFQSSDYDDRVYRHTGTLDCSGELYPSPSHPDDGFSRFPAFLDACLCSSESFRAAKPYETVFVVDQNREHKLYLAKCLGGIDESSKRNVEVASLDSPWLVQDQKDPQPTYPWFTAARYFGRQVARDHPEFTNNLQIANSVALQLLENKIYGRIKDKPFKPTTILKAFEGVNLK